VVIPHSTPPSGGMPVSPPRRPRLVLLFSAWLLASCSQQTTYPPALPQAPTGADIPWGSDLTPKRPPSSSDRGKPVPPTSVVPPEEDWSGYRPYVPPRIVCQGKGARRRCTKVQPSVVDRANQGAFVKATSVHTMNGQSVLVRYPLVLGGLKVYHIETSPQEFTRLLLPPGQHLAAKLRLHPKEWIVNYEKTEEEDETHQEVISIRPNDIVGLKGRDMLLLSSGYPIYLHLTSRERPGMLSVTWSMPERTGEPEAPPMDERPPKFNANLAYTGYSYMLEGKTKVAPPWMPKLIVDDGHNTLVKFRTSLEGQRMPAVVGLDQAGKPILVSSRLYVHPDKQERGGYWLFFHGMHPAFILKDAAGITVKVVRQAPAQEVSYAQ
jgi:Conjugal transfer protein